MKARGAGSRCLHWRTAGRVMMTSGTDIWHWDYPKHALSNFPQSVATTWRRTNLWGGNEIIWGSEIMWILVWKICNFSWGSEGEGAKQNCNCKKFIFSFRLDGVHLWTIRVQYNFPILWRGHTSYICLQIVSNTVSTLTIKNMPGILWDRFKQKVFSRHYPLCSLLLKTTFRKLDPASVLR
jgi:hypothetical protein